MANGEEIGNSNDRDAAQLFIQQSIERAYRLSEELADDTVDSQFVKLDDQPPPFQELPTPNQTVSADELLDKQIDRDERQSIIFLRKMYAWGLLILLGGQLLFMNVILILTGLNLVHIAPSTMQFYLTGTLGEIFGVVTVASKFLFSKLPFLGQHASK
jgi:hypothetical protein